MTGSTQGVLLFCCAVARDSHTHVRLLGRARFAYNPSARPHSKKKTTRVSEGGGAKRGLECCSECFSCSSVVLFAHISKVLGALLSANMPWHNFIESERDV